MLKGVLARERGPRTGPRPARDAHIRCAVALDAPQDRLSGAGARSEGAQGHCCVAPRIAPAPCRGWRARCYRCVADGAEPTRVSPAQHEHMRQLKRFNVGEDCPVFDGVFQFCQISAGGSIGGAVRLNNKTNDIVINWSGGLHHAKARQPPVPSAPGASVLAKRDADVAPGRVCETRRRTRRLASAT